MARSLGRPLGCSVALAIRWVSYRYHKHAYLDLANFGEHARHILPPFSPSQPVVADQEMICWGTLPKFFAFFLLFVTFFFCFLFFRFVFSFFVVLFFQPYGYCCTLSFFYPQILVFSIVRIFVVFLSFVFSFFVASDERTRLGSSSSSTTANRNTATTPQQQQQKARVCVFMWAGQVRDTGTLLSRSQGTGEYQQRGEDDCWEDAILGETKLAVSSALLLKAMASARCTNKPRSFVFEPTFLLLRTPRRHKPSSESQSIISTYRRQEQQISLQSAVHRATKYIP